MMNLLVVEMRRALHRRLVWGMVALALLGIAIAGVVEFFASRGLDAQSMQRAGTHDPAIMADWWIAGGGDGALAAAAFLLVMGALICGASVAGAEWRAGTITTVLTWEPNRVRLHAARVASAGLLAGVIAFALQVLLLAAFAPSVAAHGTTGGVDGAWLVSLSGALARIALLSALAAVIGCSLATLGRNTAVAIVGAWVWLAIAEGALRAWEPGLGRWLIGENSTVVLGWAGLTNHPSSAPTGALLLLLAYSAVLAGGVTWVFCRTDVQA